MSKTGKVSILTFSLIFIALAGVNFVGYDLAMNALQTQVQAHEFIHQTGRATATFTQQAGAQSNFTGDVYVENRQYDYAHLVAEVQVTLQNGTILVSDSIDQEEYGGGDDSSMQDMAVASSDDPVVFSTTSAQNLTINVTLVTNGFWRVIIYQNLPASLQADYNRAEQYAALAVIVLVLGCIMLVFGFLSRWREGNFLKLAPDEPCIRSKEENKQNYAAFNSLFRRLVFSPEIVSGVQLSNLKQTIAVMYEKYLAFFMRFKELGIKFELQPKNGLTVFPDASMVEGTEAGEYSELVNLAHLVNRSRGRDPMWFLVLFLLTISMYVFFILWTPVLNMDIGGILAAVLMAIIAAFAVLLFIVAFKVLGANGVGGRLWGYARNILMLDPTLIKHVYEKGIGFPFADLRESQA